MPYAPPELVLSAVDALVGSSPLAVVTIPAMLRAAKQAGVDPVATGVVFGSTEETGLLDEFFSLPRPPEADRPWRAPWSAQEPWQKRRYPGGGLQRLRTDASGRGIILRQTKQPAGRDVWQLTPHAGAELMTPRTGLAYKAVRIVDLAIWLGRDRDVADLDALIDWFVTTFKPDHADLLGTVYLEDVPVEYREASFAAQPIDDETTVLLGSLPVAPTVSLSLDALVTRLEGRLEEGSYTLPPGLVRRVLTAWLRGDFVVLVGQPGTGKTMFATLLGRALADELSLDDPVIIPIRADFDESEFIGYERLDGTPQLREFASAVLQTEAPLEARVVILEEFNLASIETYMAAILVAAQESTRLVRLPAGEETQLPVDTFFIATCNSFRDEPETRTRVSSPTKRRSTIVTMPNVLGDNYDVDPDGAVLEAVMGLLSAAASQVSARTSSSRAVQFDSLRQAALSQVVSLEDFSPEVRMALSEVSNAILSTPAGRSWFTMGILRDVVLNIVHAERNAASELTALGEAVADKLLHQVKGTHEDIQELRYACGSLPNADEVGRLIDRMMDGPSDELLPLL